MDNDVAPPPLVQAAGPALADTVAGLRAIVAQWRSRNERIALVPTMGALHTGHLSLIARARLLANRVIASIFVNPTQFAPGEDFERYPRSLDADIANLAEAGADAVFTPDIAAMYPDGFATRVCMEGPARAGLEDRFRPDHFDGVATIVAKLHIIAQPDIAIYGEKDFQQLAVIRQMNRDLDLPVEIVGAPTVREDDGLAMSSRNLYLSGQQRAAAPVLYATLCDCRDRILAGEAAAAVLAQGRERLAAAGFAIDYLELREASTLAPAAVDGRPLRLLTAARIGATRLIDNIPVTSGPAR